jgi:uncharacterized protein Usg
VSQSITSRQMFLHCRYSDVTLSFHCGYRFPDDPAVLQLYYGGVTEVFHCGYRFPDDPAVLQLYYGDVTLSFHCGYRFPDDPVTPGQARHDLEVPCSGVTVVLQWCYSSVTCVTLKKSPANNTV